MKTKRHKYIQKLLILTLLAVPLLESQLAIAGSMYRAKCLNRLEGDLDGCSVLVEGDEIELSFIRSSDRDANLTILASQITEISAGERAQSMVTEGLIGTLVLGPIGLLALLFKKRTEVVVIEYNDGETDRTSVIQFREADGIEFKDEIEEMTGLEINRRIDL
jgi:hypothetical protein